MIGLIVVHKEINEDLLSIISKIKEALIAVFFHVIRFAACNIARIKWLPN